MEHENMRFKYLFISMIFFASWLHSNTSLAQTNLCRFGNGNANDYQRRFSFGNVYVSYDTPNGAVLATTTVEPVMDYVCGANTTPPGGYQTYFVNHAYQSNIPGVVYIKYSATTHSLGLRFTNLDTGEVMMVYGGATQDWAPANPVTQPIDGRFRVKVELIKLNDDIYKTQLPIYSSGGWNVGVVSRGNPHSKAQYQFYWNNSNGKLIIMPNTCTVTTPSVNVPLQPIAASKLNAVGVTAGDKEFNIGLNCKSGSKVYVTLTDLTDQSNTGNQLTLTPDSSAKGVKLRILRNGQPVGYGPDSIAVGNTNQWLVGPSATTTSIPLSAQYIATGQVSGGTVKGVATFTMSYQ
ncbi:fimbrial protein [Burkholderia cepacia]|uniref:fimbrial protein n=1 Tax=Burkholderia cepacia TaxID=292 RepID=UPI0026570FD0|nr:fimbrial protein [Burkholderia cepacia]MDN7632385.1 fimbrial protein [Burkholderia cepacia]